MKLDCKLGVWRNGVRMTSWGGAAATKCHWMSIKVLKSQLPGDRIWWNDLWHRSRALPWSQMSLSINVYSRNVSVNAYLAVKSSNIPPSGWLKSNQVFIKIFFFFDSSTLSRRTASLQKLWIPLPAPDQLETRDTNTFRWIGMPT